MASDTNLVIIVGRLTRDPEFAYTNNQLPLCKFSIATNRYSRNQGESGKFNEEVDFFDITAWDKLGENCANYIKKGSKILVEGRLKQDRFQDQQTGQNRTKINIVARNVQFLDTKTQATQNAPPNSGSAQPQSPPNSNSPANPNTIAGQGKESDNNIIFEKLPNTPIDQINDDDDVPF